jgi:cell division protein FtsB
MEIPARLQEPLAKLVRSRRLLASGILVLLAAAFFAHVMLGENGVISYHRKRAEYLQLKQQLQHTEEDNQRLSDEIHGLKSDPKAIERVAREQLRYARPGEVIYLLPQEPGASTSSTQSTPAE